MEIPAEVKGLFADDVNGTPESRQRITPSGAISSAASTRNARGSEADRQIREQPDRIAFP